jgi:transporter family protein
VSLTTVIESSMMFFTIVFYLISKFKKNNLDITLYRFLLSKKGAFTILSGVIGGAMGLTFLNLGILFAGESYGIILSSLFPAMTAILSLMIFKDKINIYGLLGILIVSIASISITLTTSSLGTYKNLILGMLFGLMAGIS